jgi:Domain of unknown function (DUF1918)
MSAKRGDHILLESQSVGTPTREGEILEVITGEIGVRYRIRWQDGHESVLTPSGGSARIVPSSKPAKAASKKPAKKAKRG